MSVTSQSTTCAVRRIDTLWTHTVSMEAMMQFRKTANNIAVMAGSIVLLVTMFPLVIVVFLGFLSYALAKCEEEEGCGFAESGEEESDDPEGEEGGECKGV